jgi:hypothetical protein
MAGGEKSAGPGALEQGAAGDLSGARPQPCSAAFAHSGNAAAGGGFILAGAPNSRRSVGAGFGDSQRHPGRLDVASWRIEVTGHTDSVGSRESNRALSEQRARSVAIYLMQHGVVANRIETVGYGDTRPLAANDTETNRARNRRIEFRVKP